MEQAEEGVYRICQERNTPEAFRHFFDRDYPRLEVFTSMPWRVRLAKRFSLEYRVSRRLTAY